MNTVRLRMSLRAAALLAPLMIAIPALADEPLKIGAVLPLTGPAAPIGIEEQQGVHARGAFLACKYGLPLMNDGGGSIITSSVDGVRGGGGICVNTINPGPVDNEFQTGIEARMGKLIGANVTEQLNQAIPLKHHARPDEIASAALYFASDLSTYVTGTVHMIDGGLMS